VRDSFTNKATANFSRMTSLPLLWFCCTSVGKSLKPPTVIVMDLIRLICGARQQKRFQ